MAMVEKSPNAFRTISEVAEIIDVPAHVLRFWEGKFAQIKPVKRGVEIRLTIHAPQLAETASGTSDRREFWR